MNPPRAADFGLGSCPTCGKVSDARAGYCPRCHHRLHLRRPSSIARTRALLIAAVACYLPANLLPIMTVEGLSGRQSSTIVAGVITFWRSGSYPIAIVIFVASVVIPILKICALAWLCLAASGRVAPSPRSHSKLYHFTEILGRWSMVDIFVVAILVTVVQFGALMTIQPGPAAFTFAAVVILTMLAAASFDPRLLWDRHFQSRATR